MKEFITAVANEVEVKEGTRPIDFKLTRKNEEGEIVEERELVAHYPKDGQVALLMARMGRHSSASERVAGVIDFFVEVLDQEGHEYVVSRLLDREDEFGLKDISDIMNYLMEEWGGRPTK
jgi:hypothetical protein